MSTCEDKLAQVRGYCKWTAEHSSSDIARVVAQDILNLIGDES